MIKFNTDSLNHETVPSLLLPDVRLKLRAQGLRDLQAKNLSRDDMR